MPIAIWSEDGHRIFCDLWGVVLGRPRGVFQSLLGGLMRLGMARLPVPEDGGPLPNHSTGEEEYNVEGPDIGDRVEKRETLSITFPAKEVGRASAITAGANDSCFFSII